MKYLIDTDWAIDHIGGKKEEIRERLRVLRPFGIGISIISLAELYEGMYLSRNPQEIQIRLNLFLSQTETLGVSHEIVDIFGRKRAALRKQGQLIGDFDLLIASTALYYHLTVLSNNRKHFERIEGLQILSV